MITTSIDGAVGRVIIDRPAKRNAMSRAMWAALPGAIDGLCHDERVRIILLEGRGPDFSAGADISEFETVYADRAAAAAFAATLAAAMDAVAACARPTLAVVHGHCIGSAVGLALCCDLRFAAASSRFAITPARLGLAYSFEDTRRLVQAIGSAAAKDLLMTSRTIDADEALRLRLVDRVCDETDLAAEAQVYADLVRAASQTSTGIARDFVDRVGRGQRLEDDATRATYLDAVEGPDFAEGLRAFRARRPPRFS
jgi:enoyl-CoA hydratase/carnithine racemase